MPSLYLPSFSNLICSLNFTFSPLCIGEKRYISSDMQYKYLTSLKKSKRFVKLETAAV